MDGFERYTFGPALILDSESWQEAEQKLEEHLARRKKHFPEAPSYYSDGGKVLWREYQLLFMCQLLEFKLAELVGRSPVKEEFIGKLREKPRANAERAKKPRRLTSPASLLVDFGCTLGQLLKIIDNQTLPFTGKDELVDELRNFNKLRVDFIHHSLNRQKKSGIETTGQLVVEALRCGKGLLARIEEASHL